MPGISPSLGAGDVRFEVLPLGKSEEEAAQLPEPVRLTVTCSPKHGPDRSVEVAGRLHAMGHAVTVHIAARMVRDRAHLDELLAGMAQAGSDDLFLIGGDADPPLGEFASAVDLIPLVAEHPQRPRTIGIGGYPEGHPLIDPATLERALQEKSRYADYITTQLCFDPETLLRWVQGVRERDISIPVLVGMPGQVMPAKLLELSARIGVGTSISFLRKQRGLRGLLGMFRTKSAADDLYRALAPVLGDPRYGLGGFHYFTFNQLVATYDWQREKQEHGSGGRVGPTRSYVVPEESKT
jgi:methylenetetrahydrofolate reductase (NADPH)